METTYCLVKSILGGGKELSKCRIVQEERGRKKIGLRGQQVERRVVTHDIQGRLNQILAEKPERWEESTKKVKGVVSDRWKFGIGLEIGRLEK